MMLLRGDLSNSYNKLSSHFWDTMYPGPTIRMHKSFENEFTYLFVSLYVFIKGFNYCKLNVVVDGNVLNQHTKGYSFQQAH